MIVQFSKQNPVSPHPKHTIFPHVQQFADFKPGIELTQIAAIGDAAAEAGQVYRALLAIGKTLEAPTF